MTNAVCLYHNLDDLYFAYFKNFNDFHQKTQKTSDSTKFKLCNYLTDITNYIGVDWETLVSYNENKNSSYKRIRLYTSIDKSIEFILICWKKGQKSPIHDHAENGCLMRILKGKIQETRYVVDGTGKLEKVGTGIYKKGFVGYIDNSLSYHEITPLEDTVSLHIYSPANYKASIFKSV